MHSKTKGGQIMNNYISRQKVIIICLMMAIVVLMGVMAMMQFKVEKLQEQLLTEQVPKLIVGDFTIIQYTEAGWINPIYISEYFLDGQVLMYLEKDSSRYKPMKFEGLRFIDGWLGDDEMMKYGYWISDDLGLN
jgi:hypothetical protein